MLLEKLISGQELTQALEERKSGQYARIRQKARRSVLKNLQKSIRRSMRTGRGDGSIAISPMEMYKCDEGLAIGEESFAELLKTRGWEINKREDDFAEDGEDKFYFSITPIRS